MKIQTKFNIGDLVNQKYDSNTDEMICGIMISDLLIEVCNAGVQVFYFGRHILATREILYTEEVKWHVHHNAPANSTRTGKYREDELIPALEEVRRIIQGK